MESITNLKNQIVKKSEKLEASTSSTTSNRLSISTDSSHFLSILDTFNSKFSEKSLASLKISHSVFSSKIDLKDNSKVQNFSNNFSDVTSRNDFSSTNDLEISKNKHSNFSKNDLSSETDSKNLSSKVNSKSENSNTKSEAKNTTSSEKSDILESENEESDIICAFVNLLLSESSIPQQPSKLSETLETAEPFGSTLPVQLLIDSQINQTSKSIPLSQILTDFTNPSTEFESNLEIPELLADSVNTKDGQSFSDDSFSLVNNISKTSEFSQSTQFQLEEILLSKIDQQLLKSELQNFQQLEKSENLEKSVLNTSFAPDIIVNESSKITSSDVTTTSTLNSSVQTITVANSTNSSSDLFFNLDSSNLGEIEIQKLKTQSEKIENAIFLFERPFDSYFSKLQDSKMQNLRLQDNKEFQLSELRNKFLNYSKEILVSSSKVMLISGKYDEVDWKVRVIGKSVNIIIHSPDFHTLKANVTQLSDSLAKEGFDLSSYDFLQKESSSKNQSRQEFDESSYSKSERQYLGYNNTVDLEV